MYVWCSEYNERESGQDRRAMWLSWHVAAFQRAKRLPDIQKVLDRFDNKPVIRQNPDAMRQAVLMLNQKFGGKDMRRDG